MKLRRLNLRLVILISLTMIHPSMLVRIVTVYEGTNGVTLKGTARDTDGDRLELFMGTGFR